MAKSRYAERLASGKPLLDEILDGQIGRLERALPKDREDTLRDWVDLAEAESAVKERYRGRYLFELIQNANDAIVDAQLGRVALSTDYHLVRLELTDRSLLVANYGKPFDQNNVRALCRLHNTTKIPSKQIGHKGIGFKSVLEVCQCPEVYSGIFAFGFDRDRFSDDVKKVMRSDWDPSLSLPILKAPYPRYITKLPKQDRERIEALFDDGYVTVVRLPLAEPEAVIQVRKQMKDDVQSSLLLFMPAISQIAMGFPDGREVVYERRIQPTEHPQMNMVLLYTEDEKDYHLDSRWLMLGPIERPIPDRSYVLELDKAWHDVTSLRFAVAIPLSDDPSRPRLSPDSQPFYVYYPTKEFSGLDFAIHADFNVGDDRKTLETNRLNNWLITEICAFLAGEGVRLLQTRWPNSAELVELLAPVTRPERDFARAFMKTYLEYLSISPFVPIDGRQYKPPAEIRFPPDWADEERFRQLFPASKLRGSEKWAYPIHEVVEFEEGRDSPFLLSEQLGTQVVKPEMVVEALKREGVPSPNESYDLIEFLADWRDRMPGDWYRLDFDRLLKSIPIFPTTNGWQQPGADKGIVFQANLRPNVDDIVPPPGFEFSVIIRSVYPDTGIRSKQYDLFRSLGAREYSARDIVRDAILPVLTNPERFKALLSEHPDSIYEAYGLLKNYYLSDGTTAGFQDRLARVPVPATDGTPDGWSGWKKAGDCYLGRDWPGGEVLERIYAGFDDCFFLAEIPELMSDEAERGEWAGFFRWLGVRDRPLVLHSDQSVGWRSPDPFQEAFLWSDYMDEYDAAFKCRHPTKRHGYSRRLNSVHSLHHFADLVREGDAQKLADLCSLLAQYWTAHYKRYSHATLECGYVSTGCPSDEIESYLLFQLRCARWIPAQIGGQFGGLLSPQQIWILGETEPADVRNLVPTLPPGLRSGGYRDLAADLRFISPGTAQVEDYIRLLQLLPERYPLEVPELDENKRKRWHRSIGAVFNWICERIQTGLVSRGDDEPSCPDDLLVLAYRQEQPCYVDVQSPDLVYADNNFLAERWKRHCAFLRINDDWRKFRGWLGVPNLSEVVQSSWSWQGELEPETSNLQALFDHTLPYYLALIKRFQPANYDRLLSRLQRLRVHVVKHLIVEERLDRLPQVEPLKSPERLHLIKTDEPLPRGGRARSGDLFVTKDVLGNLDLLGDYIADYVGIARLGDAFVILINRSGDQGKLRFVESKGVTSELVQVKEDWQAQQEQSGQPSAGEEVIAGVLQKIQEPGHSVTVPTAIESPVAAPGEQGTVISDTTEEVRLDTIKPPQPEYPPLDFDNLPDIIFADAVGEVSQQPGRPGSGGGSEKATTPSKVTIPSEEATRKLGRRGEEWAYETEKQRLSQLGYDPNDLEEMGELIWVSKRQPMANYDIRSIRITESGEERPVYIEVKARAGTSRDIRMKREEFRLALSLRDDYWLYWVANIDTAQPDAPVCYPNLAQLIEEKKVDLNVDTISITLPRQTQTILSTEEGEA